MITCLLFIVVFILYVAFDVNYFIRVGAVIGFGKLFKKRKDIFSTTSILGWCTTQDLDIFMRHMSNARYIRELDFARFDFYFRTGLYEKITEKNGHALQGASTIRYRRPIATLSFFKVTTKLIYWDDKAIYLEHQFVTLDKFVRAIVITKQNTINFDPNEVIKSLAKDKYVKKEMPPELSEWLTSVETLSSKLRKSD